MTETVSTHTLHKMLTFPFDDPRWAPKLLIGWALVSASVIVPIVPLFFLYGYIYQIMRHIILDRGQPYLPEWRDWSRLFRDGLRLGGAAMLANVPPALIALAGFLLVYIPAMFASGLLGGDVRPAPENEFAVLLSAAAGLGLIGLAFLFALALQVLLPPALCHIARTGEFSAGLRLPEWWPIFKANLGGFLLVYLITFALYILATLLASVLYLSVVLICLSPLISGGLAGFYLLISHTWHARAYRDGMDLL
jgi:hypothetical protein